MRVEQRGFDPFPALFDSRVRHAHGDEIPVGAGRVHVDLDIYYVRVDALDGGAEGAEQSHTVVVGPDRHPLRAIRSTGTAQLLRR